MPLSPGLDQILFRRSVFFKEVLHVSAVQSKRLSRGKNQHNNHDSRQHFGFLLVVQNPIHQLQHLPQTMFAVARKERCMVYMKQPMRSWQN